MKVRLGWQGAALTAALLITACGPGVYTPTGVDIVVRRPPPARVEVISTAPGPGYFWVRGHYAWQGGDYVWLGGQWQRPPQPSYHRWQPGHWAHARSGWYWVEGRWR